MVIKSEVMKYFRPVVMVCLFFALVMPACIKNTVSVDYVGTKKTPEIILPKPIVKKGEPFVVSTNEDDPNTVIKWAIRPSYGTVLIPYGSEVTINISVAGSYLITASFYSPADTVKAFDSTHSTIIVNDSVYSAPPIGSGLDTVSLTGALTIVSSAHGDSGLAIIAQTVNLYNCSPYLTAYGMGLYGPTPLSSIGFDFNGAEVVEGTGNCGGVQQPAISLTTLIPPANGFYTITANLDQVNYEGSLTVSDTAYTFTWPYTSGITISPLQIKKK